MVTVVYSNSQASGYVVQGDLASFAHLIQRQVKSTMLSMNPKNVKYFFLRLISITHHTQFFF